MADGNNAQPGPANTPASSSGWSSGSLSTVEFEQLASELRPAWEVGLDAAGEGASIVAAIPTNGSVVTAGAFSAPAPGLQSVLGSLGGASMKATLSGVMPADMLAASAAPPAQPLPSIMVDAVVSVPSVRPPVNAETTAALPLSRPSAAAGPYVPTDAAAAPWEKTGRFAAVGAPHVQRPSAGMPAWAIAVAVVGVLVLLSGAAFALRNALAPEEPPPEAGLSAEPQPLPSLALPTPLPSIAMPTVLPPPPMVMTAAPSVIDPAIAFPSAFVPPVAAPTVDPVLMVPPGFPSAVAPMGSAPPVEPTVAPTAAPVVVSAAPVPVNPPIAVQPTAEPAGPRPATPRATVRPRPQRPRTTGIITESPY